SPDRTVDYRDKRAAAQLVMLPRRTPSPASSTPPLPTANTVPPPPEAIAVQAPAMCRRPESLLPAPVPPKPRTRPRRVRARLLHEETSGRRTRLPAAGKVLR